jgi:uroporphyrinogen-III synthase
MKPLIVITRTQPDASLLAAKLEALGYETLIEPMLQVRATHAATTHDPLCVEGLIVTSAQALRHLNTLVREVAFRHKPLYAVGPRTASLARDMGWVNVHDGGGDVQALGDFLKTRKELGPSSLLLHICGRDIARDTRAVLATVPGKIMDWVVYETDAVKGFSSDFREALRTGRVKGVVFYSSRAASAFAENVQAYGEDPALGTIIFLCLSDAVLKSLSSTPSGGTYVSRTPDEDALLDLLARTIPPA